MVDAWKEMDPMIWIITAAAVIISIAVLFNKAIKLFLKLAVIGVVALVVLYFLVQSGLIELPRLEE